MKMMRSNQHENSARDRKEVVQNQIQNNISKKMTKNKKAQQRQKRRKSRRRNAEHVQKLLGAGVPFLATNSNIFVKKIEYKFCGPSSQNVLDGLQQPSFVPNPQQAIDTIRSPVNTRTPTAIPQTEEVMEDNKKSPNNNNAPYIKEENIMPDDALIEEIPVSMMISPF